VSTYGGTYEIYWEEKKKKAKEDGQKNACE
jgi:hypothetical protein